MHRASSLYAWLGWPHFALCWKTLFSSRVIIVSDHVCVARDFQKHHILQKAHYSDAIIHISLLVRMSDACLLGQQLPA